MRKSVFSAWRHPIALCLLGCLLLLTLRPILSPSLSSQASPSTRMALINGRWKAHRALLGLPQLQDSIEILMPPPSTRTPPAELPLRANRFGLKQRREIEANDAEKAALHFAPDALVDRSLSFDDMIAMFRRIEIAEADEELTPSKPSLSHPNRKSRT